MAAAEQSSEFSPIVRRFIESAGSSTQSLGIGRVLGLIYAYLYFSPESRNLADMQKALGISKGSASMGVRQLEQWGAVRKVWVKGDRKDYYQASDWLGHILKNVVYDTVSKKMASFTSLLDEMESESFDPAGEMSNEDSEFIKARIKRLRKFHERALRLWGGALIQRILK